MVHISHSVRVPAILAALLGLAACAGGGHGTSREPDPQAAPAPAPSPPDSVPSAPSVTAAVPPAPPWLAVDSTARTAILFLQVTAPPGAPSALINRHRAGEVQVVVPLGWMVKWDWHNADSTSRHSLVVMVQREKIPLEGGRPAFSNAMTRMVTAGLPPGQTDQTTFVAEEPGWFWILCGVPGHALKGEWIELRVDPQAKTASVQVKKRE